MKDPLSHDSVTIETLRAELNENTKALKSLNVDRDRITREIHHLLRAADAPHVPRMLLRQFQSQLLFQAECVLQSEQHIVDALNTDDVRSVFQGLQNLVVAAGNMTKVLWGPTGDVNTALERRALRRSVGVADDSPLRSVQMRNNFEHLDQRIDEWWAKSVNHFYVDMLIGPGNVHVDHKTEVFRHFDPSTGVLQFWGQAFDVRAVVHEVRRLHPTLKAEADKPHLVE